MGSSHSSRRRRQNQQNVPPRHQHQHEQQQQSFYPAAPPPRWENAQGGPCPGMSPYFFSQHPSPPFFQQGYYVPPGQFIAPPPAPPPPPPPPPPASQAIVPYGFSSTPAPPAPPPVVPEYQKATTVRNDVNLNKGTLRLERDESNPDHRLVAFSFDATEAGSISVFILARESADGSLSSVSSMLPAPRRKHFRSGLGQKFKQDSGLDFSLIDEQDLSRAGPENLYPLIIRIETFAKKKDEDPASAAGALLELELDEDAPGGPLMKRVNCQQTYAVILRKDSGEYDVKVVKQIIWVNAVRYELQEIFGIASSDGKSNSSSDSGKECVICLSEPKDTTVLPCRHMCMCSGCADVLRFQSNLCPICRCPVEELIQIKVPVD